MDTGSAPGVTGWTGNMLSVLSNDDDCRRYLAVLCQTIINNRIPDKIRELLLTSILIPIPKDNGGIRPIAIGEMIMRCASSYAMSQISTSEIEQFFLPHQFGVNVSNGCETVIHMVQQALHHPTTPYNVLKIDMKNAFNTVPRDKILSHLFEHEQFSPIFRLAHFLYSKPSHLAIMDERGHLEYHANLQSCVGTRQGGNESSLLFAIPLQSILTELKKQFPTVVIAAIVDDITLMCPDPIILKQAYDYLRHEAEHILNLVVNEVKCELIAPGQFTRHSGFYTITVGCRSTVGS